MNAIETRALTKLYGELIAVDNLSLCIEEGELFSLLGVNGAGKTTTIKMLSCLTKPSSGDAYLMGKSITKNTKEVKSLIEYLLRKLRLRRDLAQEKTSSLFAELTAFQRRKDRRKSRSFQSFSDLRA